MSHTIYTRPARSGRRLVYCSCGWAALDTYAAHELANQAGERHQETQAEFDARTASLREPRPEPTEADRAANAALWRRFESD